MVRIPPISAKAILKSWLEEKSLSAAALISWMFCSSQRERSKTAPNQSHNKEILVSKAICEQLPRQHHRIVLKFANIHEWVCLSIAEDRSLGHNRQKRLDNVLLDSLMTESVGCFVRVTRVCTAPAFSAYGHGQCWQVPRVQNGTSPWLATMSNLKCGQTHHSLWCALARHPIMQDGRYLKQFLDIFQCFEGHGIRP